MDIYRRYLTPPRLYGSHIASKMLRRLFASDIFNCQYSICTKEERADYFQPKPQELEDDWGHHLRAGEKTVCVAELVKYLAVYFDTSLMTEKQVNAISKAFYYHIRNIGSIRRYITRDACKTLAHTFITSRLDYGNALLYGLQNTLMTHLQSR